MASSDEGSEDSEEFVIVAAKEQGDGVSAQATKIITCRGSYDHPHPGTSSGQTAINAHLTVRCTGGDANKTKVKAQSRMTDQKRLGKVSTGTGNKGFVKIGGDLVCLKKKRAYQAVGTAHITFPKGYTKISQKSGAKSKKKSFKRLNNGNCTKP